MTKPALLSDPEVRVARLPGEIAVISLLGEHDVTTAWEFRNASAFALDQGTGTRAEAIDAVRQTPDRSSAAGIGSRTTTVERREKWRCSWL